MLALVLAAQSTGELLPGFARSAHFGEQARETSDSGIRALVNAPAVMRVDRPTLLVVYTTPNGNTIEQTLGCAPARGLDWRYDIRHIAARTRRLREMNGCLYALTLGTAEESLWPGFGPPRAYADWVQPAPASKRRIPPRPSDAEGGAALMKRVSGLRPAQREAVLLDQIKRGNIPQFLRCFVTVHVVAPDANGRRREISYQVMPDYLAVGSNDDFVRVPLTPAAAQAAADAFGCVLPTQKMVDDIWRQAAIKLDPRPLTHDRESVETFVEHNSIIESQRAGRRSGGVVAGIKKDVVITNQLADRPGHVAIYGWHKLDGSPIQPLTTVHVASYVDYSHGIRLVRGTAVVDGEPRELRDVLSDPALCHLVSDEGPIKALRY